MVRAIGAAQQAIQRIEDKNGTILYQNIPETKDVVSGETAYVTASLLQGVTEGGSGTRLEYVDRKMCVVLPVGDLQCGLLDGDRKVGYGGMRYDGRWRVVAENMAQHYGLKPGDSMWEMIYDMCGAVTAPIFDTQVAFGFLSRVHQIVNEEERKKIENQRGRPSRKKIKKIILKEC